MKKKALTPGHYLIVQADFYAELAAAQKQGAVAELETAGASYDVISVPGALEIPAAIAMAATNSCPYDGFIALGCVIRGEGGMRQRQRMRQGLSLSPTARPAPHPSTPKALARSADA